MAVLCRSSSFFQISSHLPVIFGPLLLCTCMCAGASPPPTQGRGDWAGVGFPVNVKEAFVLIAQSRLSKSLPGKGHDEERQPALKHTEAGPPLGSGQ